MSIEEKLNQAKGSIKEGIRQNDRRWKMEKEGTAEKLFLK